MYTFEKGGAQGYQSIRGVDLVYNEMAEVYSVYAAGVKSDTKELVLE